MMRLSSKCLTGVLAIGLTMPLSAQQFHAGDPVVSGVTYLDVARAGDRVVAVGDRGNIIYSDDGARSWSQAQVPAEALLTAVCFADESHGWAVGHDALILGTVDGGQTWSKQYSDVLGSGEAEVAEEDVYSDDIYSDDLYSDDLYSDDPYAESAAPAVDTSGAPFLDVLCFSAERAIAVGGFGYVVETTDAGGTWEKRMDRVQNSDGWHIYGIAAVPATDTLLMVGEKGTLYRSRDNGNSWKKLDSPYEGSFFGITPLGPAQAVIYGLQGNVWVTRDQGQSWRKVKTGVTRGITDGVVLDDGTVVLVGGSGLILVSRDNMNSAALQYLPDRDSVSGVITMPGGDLLMAGEAGAKLVSGIK